MQQAFSVWIYKSVQPWMIKESTPNKMSHRCSEARLCQQSLSPSISAIIQLQVSQNTSYCLFLPAPGATKSIFQVKLMLLGAEPWAWSQPLLWGTEIRIPGLFWVLAAMISIENQKDSWGMIIKLQLMKQWHLNGWICCLISHWPARSQRCLGWAVIYKLVVAVWISWAGVNLSFTQKNEQTKIIKCYNSVNPVGSILIDSYDK